MLTMIPPLRMWLGYVFSSHMDIAVVIMESGCRFGRAICFAVNAHVLGLDDVACEIRERGRLSS